MALAAVEITIGAALGGGSYNSTIKGGSAPDIVTIGTDATTAVASATAAKAATATAKTDGAAVAAANVAVTPVENAVAVLESDGATPTQAHVNDLRGVWDTLSAACTAHNMAANTVSNSTSTADTDAGTALTDVTAVQAAATGLTGSINADVTVSWNKTNITSRNQLRAALRLALAAVESGLGGLSE